MRYAAVIFDFFGTLTTAVRRGPAHARIARSLGCDPDRWTEELDRTFYSRATGRLGSPITGLHVLATRAGGRPKAARLLAAFAQRIDAVRADAPLREEAVPVLRRLGRAGIRTAVVSDCWYELPVFFGDLPVASLVDAAVFSYEVGHYKPHVAMYRTAADRLGVDPQDCLYVGDGGSCELSGAARAGMTPIRFAAEDLADHLTFRPDHDFVGPSIARLGEIPGLLDGDLERLLDPEPAGVSS